MDSKQSLAKIGVFVLLGVNIGAYYYFWPRHDGGSRVAANAAVQEKGDAQLLPPKVPAAEPTPLPADSVTDAPPLAIPNPPAPAEIRVAQPPNDPTLKLLEHIDRDKLPDLTAPPALPPAQSAEREVPANLGIGSALSTMPPTDSLPRPDPGIAVASALTPKTPPGLWQIQTEKVGNRTQLTARLRDAGSERVVVEFHVLCDRAQTNPQTGAVQALGNVTFIGAGWKGACQAMTLPVQEPRAVFEQEVQIAQDILGTSQDGVLRGERIVWELPSPASAGVSGVTLPLSR
jgi:hypothetical protein